MSNLYNNINTILIDDVTINNKLMYKICEIYEPAHLGVMYKN